MDPMGVCKIELLRETKEVFLTTIGWSPVEQLAATPSQKEASWIIYKNILFVGANW